MAPARESTPRRGCPPPATANSSSSRAPPPRYPILVRLASAPGWMTIRQVGLASFLKLVKAPRVRQGVIFSIFSSSVNRGKGDADNQQWPPLGWRARVGHDDRLEASATVIGLRGQFSIAGWGVGPPDGALGCRPQWILAGTVVLAIGRCPASAVPNHQGTVSSSTRSRHRPITSLFT